MKTNEYTKNHVASQCYLQRWTRDGKVLTFNRRTGHEGERAPASIGYRTRFWGKDVALRAAAENTLAKLELKGTVAIDSIDQLEQHERVRVDLATFIAIHLVRTPAWKAFTVEQNERLIAAKFDEFESEFGAELDDFLAWLRSDHQLVSMLLGQVAKVATLVASMHWTLLHYDDEWLVTSDQPVAPVPTSVFRGPVPLGVVPRTGFADIFELRVALRPDLALLLSWHDDPLDAEAHGVGGDVAQRFNALACAQADAEVYVRPGSRAVQDGLSRPVPPCGPIAHRILPGYAWEQALRSRRRVAALNAIDEMIEQQIEDRVAVVTFEHAA